MTILCFVLFILSGLSVGGEKFDPDLNSSMSDKVFEVLNTSLLCAPDGNYVYSQSKWLEFDTKTLPSGYKLPVCTKCPECVSVTCAPCVPRPLGTSCDPCVSRKPWPLTGSLRIAPRCFGCMFGWKKPRIRVRPCGMKQEQFDWLGWVAGIGKDVLCELGAICKKPITCTSPPCPPSKTVSPHPPPNPPQIIIYPPPQISVYPPPHTPQYPVVYAPQPIPQYQYPVKGPSPQAPQYPVVYAPQPIPQYQYPVKGPSPQAPQYPVVYAPPPIPQYPVKGPPPQTPQHPVVYTPPQSFQYPIKGSPPQNPQYPVVYAPPQISQQPVGSPNPPPPFEIVYPSPLLNEAQRQGNWK